MSRLHFGGGMPCPPTPRDPRDDLGDLAACFDDHFDAETLRQLLADTAPLTGTAWQEIRAALAAALAAAEYVRPDQTGCAPAGQPLAEGTRVQVFTSAVGNPIGEVTVGPGGTIDIGPLLDRQPEAARQVHVRPVTSPILYPPDRSDAPPASTA